MQSGKIARHFEMSWPEFDQYRKSNKSFAILPVGAIEQHGPHLPMGTDVIIAEYLGERLAAASDGLLLPSLAYTPTFSLRKYPGTIRLTDQTFAEELMEISAALFSHGIETIYVVIAHLGAVAACKTAERKLLLGDQGRLVNLVLPGYKQAIEKFCTARRWHATYAHAEEYETSAVLAIRPELVDMDKAVSEYPEANPLLGPISIPWDEICKSGVFGDATSATAEKGNQILNLIVETSLNLIHLDQTNRT